MELSWAERALDQKAQMRRLVDEGKRQFKLEIAGGFPSSDGRQTWRRVTCDFVVISQAQSGWRLWQLGPPQASMQRVGELTVALFPPGGNVERLPHVAALQLLRGTAGVRNQQGDLLQDVHVP